MFRIHFVDFFDNISKMFLAHIFFLAGFTHIWGTSEETLDPEVNCRPLEDWTLTATLHIYFNKESFKAALL